MRLTELREDVEQLDESFIMELLSLVFTGQNSNTVAYDALKKLVKRHPDKSPYFLAGEIQRLSGDKIDAHHLITMWDREQEQIKSSKPLPDHDHFHVA